MVTFPVIGSLKHRFAQLERTCCALCECNFDGAKPKLWETPNPLIAGSQTSPLGTPEDQREQPSDGKNSAHSVAPIRWGQSVRTANCSPPRGLPPAVLPKPPQVPLWRRGGGLSNLRSALVFERSALHLEGRDPTCRPFFTSQGVPPPPNLLHRRLTLLERTRTEPEAAELLVHIAALGGLETLSLGPNSIAPLWTPRGVLQDGQSP